MTTPLPLSIALAHLLHRRRQTLTSIAGVGMGVGFFIAVAAMMQGFHYYFLDRIINVAPHILVKDEFRTSPAQPVERRFPAATLEIRGLKPKDERRGIRGGEQMVRELDAQPGLDAAPVLRGQVFLRYGSKDLAISLVGIDPDAERRVSKLEEDLIEGRLDALETTGNGILLGSGVARNLGARMGSKLTVVSPQGVSMIMKVVGIFTTGITAMDYAETYGLLKKSQILQKRSNRINQIKIRLDDVNQAEALAARIEARYNWRTEGWQESNENVFSLFRVQNIIMYSVVTAILIVSGFGIFNIISTVVNEKVRDIAILKSMGFGSRDIEHVFVLQGLIVGIVGTLLGWGLGAVLTDGISRLPLDLGDKGFIAVETMTVHRSAWQYLLAGGLAVASSMVSALLPARKAARLNPVEIIRGAA